jgi:hypothetical protein
LIDDLIVDLIVDGMIEKDGGKKQRHCFGICHVQSIEC